MNAADTEKFGGMRTWRAGNWLVHVSRSPTNDDVYQAIASYDGGHSHGACTYVWSIGKFGRHEYFRDMDEVAAWAMAEFARRLEEDAATLREVAMQALSHSAKQENRP